VSVKIEGQAWYESFPKVQSSGTGRRSDSQSTVRRGNWYGCVVAREGEEWGLPFLRVHFDLSVLGPHLICTREETLPHTNLI
jgi:hypothetical protein